MCSDRQAAYSKHLTPRLPVRRSLYPGNTLKAALDAGASYFGVQPQIIFVCLPDTSAPA